MSPHPCEFAAGFQGALVPGWDTQAGGNPWMVISPIRHREDKLFSFGPMLRF